MNVINPFLQEYDSYENTLLTEYRKNDFFLNARRYGNRQYIYYLLQLGHFSFAFINWIQTALFGLDNEEAKEIARYILREEIPLTKPTHQEDRLHDMELIGVSKKYSIASKPSIETERIIKKRFELIRFPQNHYDLRTLAALRFDGEVLAGETFGFITRELKRRFNINPEQSRYYCPHFVHDQKGAENGHEKKSHADMYNDALSNLLQTKEDVIIACESARKALDLRIVFHSQFK